MYTTINAETAATFDDVISQVPDPTPDPMPSAPPVEEPGRGDPPAQEPPQEVPPEGDPAPASPPQELPPDPETPSAPTVEKGQRTRYGADRMNDLSVTQGQGARVAQLSACKVAG